MQLLACIGMITGAFLCFRIRPIEFTDGLFLWLLKPKGSFFMVHRPSRLVDLCAAGRAFGLEPKELCFVSPKEGEAPNIMLVHMIKGGGPELRLLRPLYIYDEAGNYTEELRACYR